MASPKYFSYLNDLKYAVNIDKAGHANEINIKDFFNLVRIREGIYKKETIYTSHYVKNGERPEQISYDLYGTEAYYWTVLQCNDIVDYYNEWPLSQVELNDYILKKYGGYEGAGEVHHWETQEVLDERGVLVLPKGMYVHEGFTYEYRPNPTIPVYRTSFPAAVSNADYEQRVNEEKSNIQVINQIYISDIVRDFRNWGRLRKEAYSQYDISDTNY